MCEIETYFSNVKIFNYPMSRVRMPTLFAFHLNFCARPDWKVKLIFPEKSCAKCSCIPARAPEIKISDMLMCTKQLHFLPKKTSCWPPNSNLTLIWLKKGLYFQSCSWGKNFAWSKTKSCTWNIQEIWGKMQTGCQPIVKP